MTKYPATIYVQYFPNQDEIDDLLEAGKDDCGIAIDSEEAAIENLFQRDMHDAIADNVPFKFRDGEIRLPAK